LLIAGGTAIVVTLLLALHALDAIELPLRDAAMRLLPRRAATASVIVAIDRRHDREHADRDLDRVGRHGVDKGDRQPHRRPRAVQRRDVRLRNRSGDYVGWQRPALDRRRRQQRQHALDGDSVEGTVRRGRGTGWFSCRPPPVPRDPIMHILFLPSIYPT